MENRVFYTGVGSREAPASVLRDIHVLGARLEGMGYICRTGDARGCDDAFLKSIVSRNNIEIYERGQGTHESMALALKLHPKPNVARRPMNMMYLGRNPMQVAGKDLKMPSKFLTCWTENGDAVGGTGLTIRAANHFKVPVFNLFQYSVEAVIANALLIKQGKEPIIKSNIREIVGNFGGLMP